MTTKIQCSGVSVPAITLRTTQIRINETLDSLGHRVERASVHIIDTNGPLLGGRDKACRIVVEISFGDAIVLEDRDYHVEPLLDRIASQLEHEVRKKNDREGLLSRIVRKAMQSVPSIRL